MGELRFPRLAAFSIVAGVALLSCGEQSQSPSGEAASERLFPMVQGSRWGYINGNGEVRIQPRFDAALDFSEGLAPVMVADRWGYIDSHGKMIIRPGYQKAGLFSAGLAAVAEVEPDPGREEQPRLGYIDRSGRYVVEPRFTQAGTFSEGFARVGDGSTYGFINPKGRLAIELPPGILPEGDFHEGLALISKGGSSWYASGEMGYIDQEGEIAIEMRFIEAGDFSQGLAPAAVKIRHQTLFGYIDPSGRFIIQPVFREAESFSEGLARVGVRDRHTYRFKYGFVDLEGKGVLEPQFNHVGNFHEGLAQVQIGKKYGFLNQAGDLVIPAQFDQVFDFFEGIAFVNVGGFWHRDPSERWWFLSEPRFVGGKWGYINKSGDYVWNPSQ